MEPENTAHQDTTAQVKLDPIIVLKAQLDDALGGNKTQYWNYVQSFAKGKINRMELDFWANLFLTEEHAHLHGAFVRASINKNKKKACVVPDRKKFANDTRRVSMKEKSNCTSQHKVLKGILKSMEKDDRDQLHYFLKNIRNQQECDLGKDKVSTATQSSDLKKDEKTMNSRSEFPGYEQMYTRMKEIALNNELIGVQEDCVPLMLLALEVHLKNILHSCINKIRKVQDSREDSGDPVRPKITLRDLAFSIELSPHISALSSSLEEKIRVNMKHDVRQVR
ncbi:7888_t:CDS:2 [Acaulospora morrowiae]|uniref:7888_t:CDS:1 n=1 Tax=Acaulospora morrowiae TaxID=94023 RepID=A0A9N9EZB9_9GLOM|nr:7888_t:CDS:2 [Acaulospora morrowiae]